MNKQTEAMKLALEALEVCEQDGYIPVRSTRDAITALREALAEQPAYRAVKTYHEGKPVYVAEQPAQKRPQNCGTGYCSCIECVMEPAQQALNKMAENARELGLDYEPDIPFGDNNPGLPWDEVPQAFNDWWNADYDPTGNPFEKDTYAYWAWAGWKAAEQPAQQECRCGQGQVCHICDPIEQPAQQEPVAVHQFRNRYVTDWYDGVPDHQDGHGPYEVRTLYTSPPAQSAWVGLTDEEFQWVYDHGRTPAGMMEMVEAKLKEKNT